MNGTPLEGAALSRELRSLVGTSPGCAVGVCPPFTSLEAVRVALEGGPLTLGAQNLHAEAKGAFTGEISGAMLARSGCAHVLVGHSERRHGLGEDDALVAKKLRAALRDGLEPVLCVGETLAEREANRMAEVLVRQITTAFDGLDAEGGGRVSIAYEPVWAIGTGKVATPEQARDAHRVIRVTLERVAGKGLGEARPILYGGSVNAANASALFAEADVDGALVGGASLDAPAFLAIVRAASAP
jgi:triosephosphate isomerase